MRKAILMILVGSVLLCACSTESNTHKQVDNSNTSTGATMSSSGSAVEKTSGSAIEKKETEPAKIVIDETGQKQQLKLGNINTANRATPFYNIGTRATDYAQVIDEHYYYLRSDGNCNYTIYQDKGEKVGGFSVQNENSFLSCFTRYGERFYILLQEDSWNSTKSIKKFAYIDITTERIQEICDLTEKEPTYFFFLDKSLYYDDWSKVSMYDRLYSDKRGSLTKFSLEQGNSDLVETSLFSKTGMDEFRNCFYCDGYLYFGKHEKEKVTIYSIQAKSGIKKKILEYQTKRELDHECYLNMDDDFIYCDDFLIPKNGGNMVRVLQNASRIGFGEKILSYCFNSKYIFYIDEKYRVRRINKETLEDVVISEIKSMAVSCTEDSVYVKGYVKELLPDYIDESEGCEEEYDNPISNDLYCMDLDGKNVKKIWNGK